MYWYFVRLSIPDEEMKQMKTIGRTIFSTPETIMLEIQNKFGSNVDVINITKLD